MKINQNKSELKEVRSQIMIKLYCIVFQYLDVSTFDLTVANLGYRLWRHLRSGSVTDHFVTVISRLKTSFQSQ